MSVAPAARDLEVRDLDAHENVLRKLGKGVCRRSGENLARQAQMKLEQLEIQRLRREVARLETEHDIVKKAAAYFAMEAR